MIVIGTFLVDGVALIDKSLVASIKSGGESSSLSLIADKKVSRIVVVLHKSSGWCQDPKDFSFEFSKARSAWQCCKLSKSLKSHAAGTMHGCGSIIGLSAPSLRHRTRL